MKATRAKKTIFVRIYLDVWVNFQAGNKMFKFELQGQKFKGWRDLERKYVNISW